MTLDEYVGQFTEEEWETGKGQSQKLIWNTAINSAMEECQKEIDALKRSKLSEHATGALGCKNAIEKLLSK